MDKDEALKLALEALEANFATWSAKTKAIPIIKEALAQPEQEPEAWQVKYRDDEGIPQIAWFPHPVHSKSPLAKRPYTEEPLYTTPPQRKPLTDEQIGAILEDPSIAEKHQGNWLVLPYAYARAIEAAHGIKE